MIAMLGGSIVVLMSSEREMPQDPPQPERRCVVPGCSEPATETRDRLIHETSVGRARQVTFDVCDGHAAEFDADPDGFIRRIAGA